MGALYEWSKDAMLHCAFCEELYRGMFLRYFDNKPCCRECWVAGRELPELPVG